MTTSVPPRNQVPVQHTWDVQSVFASHEAWDTEVQRISDALPALREFQGRLGESASILAEWFERAENLALGLRHIYTYSSMLHNVDTADQDAKNRYDRAGALFARASAATAFAEPEMIAIGFDTLRSWVRDEPRLATYAHYFDRLERRQEHVRSAEVEEVLGLAQDAFQTASATHGVLADTDLVFGPAKSSAGESIPVENGNLSALLTDPDREIRRTAWESYSDGHLALKNTMANCLAAGVKQHVFLARSRKYGSSLEAALGANNIPVEVFHNLLQTYKKNLPTWHKYWSIRRKALGYDSLHVYDIKAPLTSNPPVVPYEQAVEWIADGMRPLGDEYVSSLRRGTLEERWVDIYPNQHKTSGAYSNGSPGTHPFILMSYTDDIFGMSTLAHELGHSMHSYFTWQNQPLAYSWYGLFVAEVASNFNQALVRAHLMQMNDDPDFQIALIEEAMSNFHRYFFIMPSLARFELEIHERAERGEGLTADSLIGLMLELFREGYGDEVEIDPDRIGITWAQFSGHMYANFYVYQYATGISAANALAQRVLTGGAEAADGYLSFLKAGGSLYPLDALKLAGVDMASPEPVERTFDVLAGLVNRLGDLVNGRARVPAAGR
jgi:oligoendopeptidase F